MGIARKFIAQEVHKFSLCFSDRSVYDDIKKITLRIIKNDVDILSETIEVFSRRSMFGAKKNTVFHSIFKKDTGAFSLTVSIEKRKKRKMKDEYS